ncbi:hypothetical protein LOD99_3562 [Oopsacas minuta]|uniref:AAA+ ATPase domain-containing protein n=1 Tax=Oopsacas minuta TaxID=111878 RepID=A0AAV7JWK6_9METZ|nr:hypothetical protein LOD99_3562 [Oopsacas minuta]
MIRFLAQFRIALPLYRNSAIIKLRRVQFSQNIQILITNKPSLAKRAKKFWDDNPFTQIALLVCVLVVSVASVVEWAQKKKKGAKSKSVNAFNCLPVTPLHSLYRLNEQLILLNNETGSSKYTTGRIVSIVGERGSGKTELARQFVEELLSKDRDNSFIRKLYKPNYYVMTIDMSGKESMFESFLKCASLLQVPSSEISVNYRDYTDEQIGALLSSINDSVRKKQVICILDNVDSLQDYQAIISNKFWKIPSLLVVTSRQSLDTKVNLEINLNRTKLEAERLENWIQGFGFDDKDSRIIAETFNCITKNFQVFSLICHSLSLLKRLSGKLSFDNPTNSVNLQSITNSLQQQLPQELKCDVDNLRISSFPPLTQLQLIELVLVINSTRVSQHSVDLLAKLSPTHVLPVSTLISYLHTPLLELEEQLRANTAISYIKESQISIPDVPETDMGYWEFVKHTWKKRKQMIELMNNIRKPKVFKFECPLALQILKESPLFRWENDLSNGFQGVKFRSEEIHSLAADLFELKTIPQMEQIEVSRGKTLHTSSLLSKLSTFNPALHLQKYRSSLPGINTNISIADPKQLHKLSYLHRVMQSLARDYEKDCEISHGCDVIKSRLLSNHGDYLLAMNNSILLADRVAGLRFRAAKQKLYDTPGSVVATLREIASIQESNQSTPLVELANTYSQLGRAYLLLGETTNGHSYYQQAANLYERAMTKLSPVQQMEHAKLLYRYGVELSYNKQMELSKHCLEGSVAVLNIAGAQCSPTQQLQLQGLVFSSMIELSHVYISLGALSYAAKMIHMAENLSKNLPVEDIPDLAQLYNLKALVKSLTGDRKGYVQLKQKAGDVFAAVSDKPFVY